MKLLYKEQLGRNKKWKLHHAITDECFINEFKSSKNVELDFIIEYLEKHNVLFNYDGLDLDSDYFNVYVVDDETREEILAFEHTEQQK